MHSALSLLFALLFALLTVSRSAVCAQEFEILFSDNKGRKPGAGLVKGSDGSFYGVTMSGGASGFGTIFKVSPEGALTTLVSFNSANGGNPRADLVEGSDGNFYGTTYEGGTHRFGTIFKMTPSGVLTTLLSFHGANGSYPDGRLVEGSDGNFYGTTYNGGSGESGTVFKVTPGGVLTTLVAFNGTTGRSPVAGLVRGSDGNFYGTTAQGGANGQGVIFKITPEGSLTTLFSFNGANGGFPSAELVEGPDGSFYGTTISGGGSGKGTIFKVTSDGSLTTLTVFTTATGGGARGRLITGSGGNFYGTTETGGANNVGTIFKVTPDGTLTTLLSFNSSNGHSPIGGLALGNNGDFYGATFGAAGSSGSIFKVTPAGVLTSLVSFNSTNGRNPRGSLLEGSDGNFYGVSNEGGTLGQGAVFKMTPAGNVTTFASFGSPNGRSPQAGLVEGNDGNLYGTTVLGGTNDHGTVFKVTPTGTVSTLVSFNSTDGSRPVGSLVDGGDGNFYGTTRAGGINNNGTIFRVTPTGILTTLVFFNSTNGRNPYGKLAKGSDGNFYGTTDGGGASGYGTIFKVTPDGELTTLVSFNSINGSYPRAGLVLGSDGDFYGTTYHGGAGFFGTVFKVTRAGALTTLVSFTSNSGKNPNGELVEGKAGTFYGMTFAGGANDSGTIFKITSAGVLTTLHSFDDAITAYPNGTPIFASDGNLYGAASQMVIWRYLLATAPGVTLAPAGSITANGATLAGTVTANRADTTVTFDYGQTPEFGNSIAAIPGTVTGTDATAVSVSLSGLAPHATYYYRLTATNSEGSTSTEAATFTTANSLPVAVNDSIIPTPNSTGPRTYAVLGNDSDADGDSLTITRVSQGMHGTVTTDGTTITYTPGTGFLGYDSFDYTISDGIATATAQVYLRATALFTRVFASQGGEVPGAGVEGSGVPDNSFFKSFGVPAINAMGKVVYTASYSTPESSSEMSVLGFDPVTLKSTLAARQAQIAPGTDDALFSTFKDPLINEVGDIAFLATLTGGDANKRNNQGIWVKSSPGTGGPSPDLVARTGAQPPGVAAGARWKSFVDVAFSSVEAADSDAGVNAVEAESHWSLAFTAFMSTGAGGVKSSNDLGLWIATPGKVVLALREDQKLFIGETEKQIRSFAALKTVPGAPGQGGGMSSTGGVAVQAFFKDGTQALLRIAYDRLGDAAAIEVIALPGAPVIGEEESAAKFGVPGQSSAGAVTAWVGTLTGKGRPAAVFQRNQSEPDSLEMVARKGDTAPGTNGGSFSSFRGVAVSDSGSALFLGKVSGRGVSRKNDGGLWWKKNGGDSASVELLAREGAQPAGAPEGAKWGGFSSMALPGGSHGPLFTARLVTANGKPWKGWGSKDYDLGLWAMDSKGELRLVVHEGQEMTVEAGQSPMRIKSFTVLGAVAGSPAQRRSYNAEGRIIYRALFTDGSQAVMWVQLP